MREEISDMSEDDESGDRARWAPDLSKTSSPSSASSSAGAGGPPPFADSPPPFSDQILENVLENVLEFLTSRRDRNAASAVCHSWYRAEAQTRRELFIGNCYAVSPRRAVERFRGFKSIVLKGKPRFADFNLVPYGWGANFAPWVHSLGVSHPFLERICLKRMTVTDDDLNHIAMSFPFFKDLSLICCEGFSTLGLAVIAEKCRHLRMLDLIEDYVEDEEDEVVDWISKFPLTTTTLESLVFDCVGCPFNFASLESLVSRSPNLKRLRLNQHVSLDQLRRLVARAPQLSHLGTGAFRSDPAGAAEQNFNLELGLEKCKGMVCLSGFREIEPEFLPAIYPVCGNLTSLNFSFASLTAEELKPVIRQCHNLQTFWVLDTVGDEGLQAVAETCKKLRELRVFPLDATEDSDGSVSDIGLQLISEGCPKLRSILYFCNRMTNQSVIAMSHNCPDLVVFRLCIMGRRRPDRVTNQPMDEGFGAIVKNCRKLTRLSVSGLLTDKAFEYIGRYGKSVRTLAVAFAGDSDLGLEYVLRGCEKLQKLEIRDCPSFGDVALRSGLPFYYNMRFLWMSSCGLSVRACREVAESKRDLVVEVIREGEGSEEENFEEVQGGVEKLYLYRSLAGPRNDAPKFVKIL